MSSSRPTMRVLLVDDQILFVESLRCVLEEKAPDLDIIGIAHDGNEAFFMTTKLRPDIILMDVRMPGMDGVQATIKIRKLYPEIKILMLTTFDDDSYVKIALKCGAVGYLLKNIPPDELIRSIRAIRSANTQIAPEILSRLLADKESDTIEEMTTQSLESLTHREQEILELIMQAMSNVDIAKHLDVSEQTIKNHVHNLYAKLGVTNRLKLIKLMSERQR